MANLCEAVLRVSTCSLTSWCLLWPTGKKNQLIFVGLYFSEKPSKGAYFVFQEILVSPCSDNAFQKKKRNNSFFSWGSSKIILYGSCHIMDPLGYLVHLVLTCFVVFVVFVVFKQRFGTQIYELAMRGSQRGFFCLDTLGPFLSQKHSSCGVQH